MFPLFLRSRSNHPLVKVCCIGGVEESRLAIAAGAAAIGLVSRMPSGPGVIADTTIRDVVLATPAGIATFLLTPETSAHALIGQQRRLGASTLQLVDDVETEVYRQLRFELPDVALVQVIHVMGEASLAQADRVAGHVDAILLDSGNPALVVKELGGTGRVHDWAISRRIRDNVDIPVFLAGGLNPANVASAIAEVNPFGVDVCSGLRTGGKLDSAKLSAFFGAVSRSGLS